MNTGLLVFTAVAYVALLFLVAYVAERRSARGRSLVNNPIVYSLSLAVYCSAWTFYGSVGRAASHGPGFLPIYLGPAILAPVWLLVLKKIILISKSQRITSVADFLSSRYGKSRFLGMLATLLAAVGIIPYIAVQLKALATSFAVLGGRPQAIGAATGMPVYEDSAFYLAGALALFAILFGARRLDPHERHEGMVAAIAFESLIKLLAFLAVGIFVTYSLFDGFGDLFAQAGRRADIRLLFTFDGAGMEGWEWFWLIALSMSAILFLPRQFHMAVVENTNPDFVARASWLFPLYLLLINIFVLPIALAGRLQFPDGGVEADTYVLHLPLTNGSRFLALLAGIGGFSAATSMVIVGVIALSIMISNNLVLPLLLVPRALNKGTSSRPIFPLSFVARRSVSSGYPPSSRLAQRENSRPNISPYLIPEAPGPRLLRRKGGALGPHLLGIRRVSIILVLLLAYGYFRMVGATHSLVSIGLLSFTAIAQFAPVIIGGLYWKRGTRAGAIGGLLAGSLVWLYTLPLPTLVEPGYLPASFLTEGPAGIGLLRPYALFGLEGLDPISHTAFWSLFFNGILYVGISLHSRPSALEITQADLFVDIYKYRPGQSDYDVRRRRARLSDIRLLLQRFLGERRTQALLAAYEQSADTDLTPLRIATADLINYAETHLAGAIGAASAKLIIASITREDPISLEEMMRVLEQTQEAIQYGKALEKKSAELEELAARLRTANEQLRELDRLKADFISTVTHELRTPLTAIKSLSKILLDDPGLPEGQRNEFLTILVGESERLTRLINQVLDLEKLQSPQADGKRERIDLEQLLRQAVAALRPLMDERGIRCDLQVITSPVHVLGDRDRLLQVAINLLSNAVKFCPASTGEILVSVGSDDRRAFFRVQDNGPGIAAEDQQHIFEKFTQIQRAQHGKPPGSGLGLFISRTIVEQHHGRISLVSEAGKGALFGVELPLHDKGNEVPPS